MIQVREIDIVVLHLGFMVMKTRAAHGQAPVGPNGPDQEPALALNTLTKG